MTLCRVGLGTTWAFNKRHTSACDNFYYGDSVKEKAEKYKYLGVVYNPKYPDNVLKDAFSNISSQAGRAVFSLHIKSNLVLQSEKVHACEDKKGVKFGPGG